MARRLILDTGVLIASERGRAGAVAEVVDADDDVAIAAVTVAELRTGIELASARHRAARTEFLVTVLATLSVELYDVDVAEAHGRLLAHVHREGRARGAHDLIIAATAIATKRIVLTTDRRARFPGLPGVDCLPAVPVGGPEQILVVKVAVQNVRLKQRGAFGDRRCPGGAPRRDRGRATAARSRRCCRLGCSAGGESSARSTSSPASGSGRVARSRTGCSATPLRSSPTRTASRSSLPAAARCRPPTR